MEMHFENDDLILNGVNIQDEITLPEISEIVSQYASIQEVRSKLVVLQRKMSEKYNRFQVPVPPVYKSCPEAASHYSETSYKH